MITRNKRKFLQEEDEQNEDFQCIEETQEEQKQSQEFIQNRKNAFDNLLNNIVNKYVDQKDKQDKYKELNEPYNTFLTYVDQIYEGSFFDRTPIEEDPDKLIQKIPEQDIQIMNKELKKMQKLYQKQTPSIVSVLNTNISTQQKMKLLEQLHLFANSELMSQDYQSHLKYLLNSLNLNYQNPQLYELEQEILKESLTLGIVNDYKQKILLSQMSKQNKIVAYSKLQRMESLNEFQEEYSSQKMWLDNLLSIPFNRYKGDQNYNLQNIKAILDQELSFLDGPKDQIMNLISQTIRNPTQNNLNVLGIYGTKGTGKTEFVKSISKALNRPYRMIPLGGESDASLLTGHIKTYVGSTPGRIIEILNETQCMNPIILFDELDKVSEDNKGLEIINCLIHLTDSTTNKEYSNDKYFSGINFDLSKILFVFTFNDIQKINKILSDRLYKIKINDYNQKQKFEIAKKHIIPNILKEFNLNLKFQDDTIKSIILQNNDSGMRTIKRKIQVVVSRINTLICAQDESIIYLDYKQLYNFYHNQYNQSQLLIPSEHLSILLKDSSIDEDKLNHIASHMYV